MRVSVDAVQRTVTVNGVSRYCACTYPLGVAEMHWDGGRGYVVSFPSSYREPIEWFSDPGVIAPFVAAWRDD